MVQNNKGQNFSRHISKPATLDKQNQPKPAPPTVSIIVRCKGRLKSLKQTLKFSLMQTYPFLEVIVVNYNSPDKLHEWLEEEFSNLISIGKLVEVYVPETLYFDHAHSRNVGLKHALGDWVLYLDAEVQPNTKLVHYFVDRVSPILDIFGCLGANCPFDAAGTLFAKRSDLIELGGFMENLEGWGYEDGDMRDRLYLLGREMFAISGSMVQTVTHPNYERCMYFKPPLHKQELENAGKWLEENKARNYNTSKEYIAKRGYRANQDKEWGQDGYVIGSGQRWLEQLKKKPIEQLRADLYQDAKSYIFKWDHNTGALLNERELLAIGCPEGYIKKARESYQAKRQNEERQGDIRTINMNRVAIPGVLPETINHAVTMKLPTTVDIPAEKSDDLLIEIPGINSILTTYLTGGRYPQRTYAWKNDDFALIKDFYNSVIEHDLNCHIFYDGLSTEFVEKYTTDRITFVKVDGIKLNPIDCRWGIYHRFLTESKDITKVFCLDICDVVILKDPFKIVEPNKLYIGDEMCNNAQNGWMTERYNMIRGTVTIPHDIMSMPVLNCGILGGDRNVVLNMVERMAKILEDVNMIDLTIDMAVANIVAYTHYSGNIVHGLPLNTRFRGGLFPYNGANNGDGEACIRHK